MHGGCVVNLLVSNCIAHTATTEARKRLSDAAFALAIRAVMARTCMRSHASFFATSAGTGVSTSATCWTCMDHETRPVRTVTAQ